MYVSNAHTPQYTSTHTCRECYFSNCKAESAAPWRDKLWAPVQGSFRDMRDGSTSSAFLALSLPPPPYSCDTVSLAFAKMLSLGKPVRGWYETERSYHTSALWLCTDVPCLSFLTVHYSFELPFLHSWSCLYVWRTFFPSFLNRLLFLRMLPFFCAASAHFIFFSFLLEYDIALKRINAIMWCIWQGYFQKGKCFSSTMIWKTEEASLKILWPIWVTSDQKKGKRHKVL